MGYTKSTLLELAKQNFKIIVIRLDNRSNSGYTLDNIDSVTVYNLSSFKFFEFFKFVSNYDPDITVVSGWMCLKYLAASFLLRLSSHKVVVALDGQWYGTMKQYFMQFIASSHLARFFYSHAWVCGPYQYEYGRTLRIPKNNFVFSLYSAEHKFFSYKRVHHDNSSTVLKKYRLRFIFVGRLSLVKGIDLLLDAWRIFSASNPDCELVIVGRGSYKINKNNLCNVLLYDFMQPSELIHLFASSDCFILPSVYEPWGVVVHEAAALGLPIICSRSVGASSTFLINNYNGFLIDSTPSSILNALVQFSLLSADDVSSMRYNSIALSKRITPYISAMSLASLL